MPRANPEERYAALIESLHGSRGVTHELGGAKGRTGFGSTGQLKVNNRIFAMLVRGSLVLKLPRARVDALVASGLGTRFDPRRNGRLMKEWVVIAPPSQAEWLPLAREALTFVRSVA